MNRLRHMYCAQSFFSAKARSKRSCRQGRLEVIGCQGRSVVGEHHGAKSLTARNSAERLGASAIRNREDPRFLDTVNMSNPYNTIYSTTIWYADINMWPLYFCSYSNTSYDFVFSLVVYATAFTYIQI